MCFHEWSDLVFGQVFGRIKKVERIPAHGQHLFQCFDGTHIRHQRTPAQHPLEQEIQFGGPFPSGLAGGINL